MCTSSKYKKRIYFIMQQKCCVIVAIFQRCVCTYTEFRFFGRYSLLTLFRIVQIVWALFFHSIAFLNLFSLSLCFPIGGLLSFPSFLSSFLIFRLMDLLGFCCFCCFSSEIPIIAFRQRHRQTNAGIYYILTRRYGIEHFTEIFNYFGNFIGKK